MKFFPFYFYVILFKNSWGKNQFKSHLIQLRNIMTFTIRDKKET